MSTGWLKKLRGLLGLGAVGGAMGAVFGVGWALVVRLLGGGLDTGELFWGATIWGSVGAFAAIGIGGALALTSGGREVGDLSAWRSGLVGALFGAAAPTVIVWALTGSFGVQGLGVIAALGAAIGGGLGVGLVRIAQRDSSPALTEGETLDALTSGELGKTG